MSQNTSYSSEKYSYSLSPLNFRFPLITKRSLSCPSYKSKYPSLKINVTKNESNIFLYESSEKEKDATNSSKKTKSTNSNTINEERKLKKVYAGLNNILTKFLLDEELLLNSQKFFPKNLSKLPLVIDFNRNMMENA